MLDLRRARAEKEARADNNGRHAPGGALARLGHQGMAPPEAKKGFFIDRIAVARNDNALGEFNPWKQYSVGLSGEPRKGGQDKPGGEAGGGGGFRGGGLRAEKSAPSLRDASPNQLPSNLITKDWNPAMVPERAFLTPQPADFEATPAPASAAAAHPGMEGPRGTTYLGPLFGASPAVLSQGEPPRSQSVVETRGGRGFLSDDDGESGGMSGGGGGGMGRGELLPASHSVGSFPAWDGGRGRKGARSAAGHLPPSRPQKFDPLELPAVDMGVLQPLFEHSGVFGPSPPGSGAGKRPGVLAWEQEGGKEPMPSDVKKISDVMNRNGLRKIEAALDEDLQAWARSDKGMGLDRKAAMEKAAASTPLASTPKPKSKGRGRHALGDSARKARGEPPLGEAGGAGARGGSRRSSMVSMDSGARVKRRESGNVVILPPSHLSVTVPRGPGDDGPRSTKRPSSKGAGGAGGGLPPRTPKTPAGGSTPGAGKLTPARSSRRLPKSNYLGDFGTLDSPPASRQSSRPLTDEDKEVEVPVASDAEISAAAWGGRGEASEVMAALTRVTGEVSRQVAGAAGAGGGVDRAHLIDLLWKERAALYDRATQALVDVDRYHAEVAAAAQREKSRVRVLVGRAHDEAVAEQAARRAALESELATERAIAADIAEKSAEVRALHAALDSTGRDHSTDIRRLSKINKDLGVAKAELAAIELSHAWMAERKGEVEDLIARGERYLEESPDVREGMEELYTLSAAFTRQRGIQGSGGLTPRPETVKEVNGLTHLANTQARVIGLDAKLAAAEHEVEYLTDRVFQWNVLQLRRERFIRWSHRYAVYLGIAGEFSKEAFTAAGPDCHVRYLRTDSKTVSNKLRMNRRETVKMVRDLWRDKKLVEGRLNKKIALSNHISDYMIRQRGIGHLEQMYSFVAALKNFDSHAEVRLMWCVLVGEVDESVHEDQQAMLEGLQYMMQRIDREAHGQRETGHVHITEMKMAMRHFFHNISDPRFDSIIVELSHDLHKVHYKSSQALPEMVKWRPLFTDNEPDDPEECKFLEKIRSIHITEVLEYIRDVEVALLMQYREEGMEHPDPSQLKMTLTHAYTALKEVDPHRKGKFLNLYLERGWNMDVIHSEAQISIQEFVDNLARNTLKRRSQWDSRMALARLMKGAAGGNDDVEAPSKAGAPATAGAGRWGKAARSTGVSGHRGYKRSIMLGLNAARKMQSGEVGQAEVYSLTEPHETENAKAELTRRATLSNLDAALLMASKEHWEGQQEKAMGMLRSDSFLRSVERGTSGPLSRQESWVSQALGRESSVGSAGSSIGKRASASVTIDQVMQEMEAGRRDSATSGGGADNEDDEEEDESGSGPYVEGLKRGFTMNYGQGRD